MIYFRVLCTTRIKPDLILQVPLGKSVFSAITSITFLKTTSFPVNFCLVFEQPLPFYSLNYN